jgi:DNA-binding NarL/FixJ family response regulator
VAHPLDQIRIVTRAYAVTTIDYCYLDSVLSSIRSRMRFIKVAIIGCCAVVRENFLLLLEKSERIGSVESYETSEAFFGEEVQSSHDSDYDSSSLNDADVQGEVEECFRVVLLYIEDDEPQRRQMIKRLKNYGPSVEVIALSKRLDCVEVCGLFGSGATGYLEHGAAPEKVVEAVYEVSTGGAVICGKALREVVQLCRNLEDVRDAAGKLRANDGNLSGREYQVVKGLASGLCYKEIAQDLGISIDTVRGHIRRVYHKLEVHSRFEAVKKIFH